MAPPPKLKVSEWADKYRKLSSENAAEPGQWHTDRAPYQREIMDAINDPRIEKVVVQSSSQVGKSEIILNVLGYFIDIDPGPILLIQPTIEMAEDFSKRRIAPMIRDTEAISKKVAEAKTRDINNTILMKVFPGGFLAMGGANSPAGLASRPIRILLADEVDRYPSSAGTEGDPLLLAEKRTSTFWNRKMVYVSTPTIKGASRIEEEYEKGTQERWCVSCPHCGDYFYIEFRDIRFDYKKYERKGRIIYEVKDVRWRCPACMHEFSEHVIKKQPAQWIADNPDAEGIRSFKLNAFNSPWAKWRDIVKEFLYAKDDPEKLKVFTNTLLGESWEDRGEIEDEEFLLERREEYLAELPDGVLLLTCGIDVQDDRLEYEVVGWGKFDESWGIEKGFIIGRPDDESTWSMLDDKLNKVWRFNSGKGMLVALTCIDSGGHFTQEVYRYCKKNEYRRIFPVKGQGGPGIPFIKPPSRNNSENVALFVLGVDSGKSSIMASLKVQNPGPKYCHFPLQEDRGYDRNYFLGLLSEKMVLKKKNGQVKPAWERVRTNVGNEALDCRNYAFAALKILNPNYDLLEKRLKDASPDDEIRLRTAQKLAKKRTGCVKKGIQV